MCSQSQPPTSNPSSHQSSYQFTIGGEMEPLADADAAAEFLQVSPRRILELARRGVLPGYPLGSGPRHLWRFRLSETCSSLLAGRVQCKRQSHVP